MTEVKLGEEIVILDADLMKFNEHTLSHYMETESGWYDYYGQKLALAEYIMQKLELSYDVMYGERFKEHKDNGCTEKLAEANSKSDSDVVRAKKEYLEAKYHVRLLQNHIRAWDRSHENAQSRGHFLRKEMDKLGKDIQGQGRVDNFFERNLDESKLEEIIKSVDPSDLKELV